MIAPGACVWYAEARELQRQAFAFGDVDTAVYGEMLEAFAQAARPPDRRVSATR